MMPSDAAHAQNRHDAAAFLNHPRRQQVALKLAPVKRRNRERAAPIDSDVTDVRRAALTAVGKPLRGV